MSSKARVFVTDGSYRNALAAVRALGTSGFDVTVGERAGMTSIASLSRYCSARMTYPDPRKNPAAAIAALNDYFMTTPHDAVLPVGLEMTALFETNRDDVRVPVMRAPSASFQIALDKGKTFEHAMRVGIPIPKTVESSQWATLALPVVFKHPRKGAWVARTRSDAQKLAQNAAASGENYVAQEYIPGQNGYGYFGFFQDGRETGYFMHERLMQFPKEGGPSVVARSVREARLHELGRTLLESLEWNGAAMVEFKRSSRDEEYYLMEINPKLWGSLDLAIVAGCNFPAWTVNALLDGRRPPPHEYSTGLTYQFVFPLGLKAALKYPDFRGQFVRNMFSSSVRSDWRWSDMRPSISELGSALRNAIRA